jgi:hypothetical protein
MAVSALWSRASELGRTDKARDGSSVGYSFLWLPRLFVRSLISR